MIQSAHFQMPYLVSGEVIRISIDKDNKILAPLKDGEKTDRAVSYDVLVDWPNGSRTVLSKVVQACMFGGIGDFFQSRLRASFDSTNQHTLPEKQADSKKTTTTLGSRVIIAFICGDTRKPVIIGHLPHPQRAFDIPDKTKNETQSKFAYKGIECWINDAGEMKFVARGSPAEATENSKTELKERKDVGPKELAKRESIAPLPSPAIVANVPPKLLSKPSLIPTENTNLKYPDAKYTTESGFLELGEWYIVDSEGQTIMLDRDSKTLTLTNGLSTIQLDKAHKKVFIQSEGDLEVTSKLDYVLSCLGNKHQTITKNEWYAIKGDEFRSVGNTRTTNIIDKDTSEVGSEWTVNIGTAKPIAGATGKAGGKHKATIKLSTGNEFTIDDDNIYIIHKTGALLTMDKTGNISMMAKDGTNIYLNAKESVLTLMSKKGALVSIDDKITLIDKTGKQMIVMKDGGVDITSGGDVNVTGKNVTLAAGNVNIGDKATMSAVLGENLQSWLDAHTHPTGAGPSGPPLIPTATYTKTPMDILSAAVKVRKGGP